MVAWEASKVAISAAKSEGAKWAVEPEEAEMEEEEAERDARSGSHSLTSVSPYRRRGAWPDSPRHISCKCWLAM